MTELEQQLLSAFERLSKQYEAEQQWRQRQIEDLSQQVQDLSAQVSSLTAAYNTLVEAWNREWQ
jgi:uncharacterized protein YkwD